MNIQKPQDIHQSDKQQMIDYINYIEDENYKGMIDVIYNSDGSEKDNLIGKCVVKDFYNSFIDAFIQEEDYNQNGVLDTLQKHINNYNIYINRIKVMGTYDKTKQYYENNVVYYNNDAYFVISKPTVGILPTNTNYFIKLGLRGDKGVTSIGTTNCMVWKSNITYEQYNMVEYNDALYVSKSSNTNKIPSDNLDVWSLAIDYKIGSPEFSVNQPDSGTKGSLWMEII